MGAHCNLHCVVVFMVCGGRVHVCVCVCVCGVGAKYCVSLDVWGKQQPRKMENRDNVVEVDYHIAESTSRNSEQSPQHISQ